MIVEGHTDKKRGPKVNEHRVLRGNESMALLKAGPRAAGRGPHEVAWGPMLEGTTDFERNSV